VQGQELAIIDSGDLAAIYADIEKARSSVTLTKKGLDRQMGLERMGGTAIRTANRRRATSRQATARTGARRIAPARHRISPDQKPVLAVVVEAPGRAA